MIVKCTTIDRGRILDYIDDDYSKCLYLYLDIIEYGCISDVTRSWIQINEGQTTAVFLAYHSALHIYSRHNNLSLPEVGLLVEEIKPTMVNATAATIKKLEPVLLNMGYCSEFGHIGEWMGNLNNEPDDEVLEATDMDIPEVARMLYEDESIGASYTYDDLLMQMRERLNQGFVHSFVIHRDNQVAAHVGTGAETDKVCTIAYTITSPKYRGQGLAAKLYQQVCGSMKREGKSIFSVYYYESARAFHHKVGFVDVCECGKLYKSVE